MWPLDHELEAWFDDVDRKREHGRPKGDDETVPMMENEFSRR